MQDYRIGRLRGGYAVSWTDPATGNRRRYRLAALTAKGAEAEALDVIARERPAATGQTVADLWTAYVADRAGRPVATTMRYTGLAVLAHFGALRPDQITTPDCRAYMAARTKAGIKPGSTWTELGHLRTVLTWAVKMRLLDHAPHIERPQKPAPKDRWLTEAEVQRLLAAPGEPHVRLAALLMLTTAGRVGAILDLTWDRVDLQRAQINLRVDQDGPRKGRAVVPINATLMAALTTAREAALSDYVVERAGARIHNILKGFGALAARAGLDGISPHTLRHTAAVHMAAGGVPMSRISQFLGHSSTAVTERVYARYAPDHLADAAAILDFGKIRSVK